MRAIKWLTILIVLLLIQNVLTAQTTEEAEKMEVLLTPLTKATDIQDSSEFYKQYNRLLDQYKRNKNDYLFVSLLNKKSIFLYYTGHLKEGVACYDTAIKIATARSMDYALLGYYMNRGAMKYSLQKFSDALKDYKQSEALMLKLKSEKIGGLLGNISLLYREIGDLENAKKYLHRSMPFVKATKDISSYAKALNNLGLIYKDEKNYVAADSLFKIGYAFSKTNQLKHDFSDVCYNLVVNLRALKKYNEAIPYNLELLEHVKKHKDASWEKLILHELAKTYLELNKISEAKKYLKLSEQIKVNEETTDKDTKASLLSIAEVYFKLKDFEKASGAYSKYFEIENKGSIQTDFNIVNQLTYSYEKKQDSLNNAKELEISQLEAIRNQEKAEHKLQQQRILLALAFIVLTGIIVFAYFLYRSNKTKEKANSEILNQKKLITEKNKEITDSIKYAKHIQNSLLPSTIILNNNLKEHFLLYLPKDIVSGDFFWVKEINENEAFVAVADCTGHGVPGAIMSALSIQQLNEISEKNTSPAKILSALNMKLKNNLQQQLEGVSKDGLDICLCKYNRSNNQLVYAGANRNLWVFNKNGFKSEIKATKAGIAGHTSNEQLFEEHLLKCEPDDFFILSSDGYADQFGGENNKKITTKQFKSFVSEKSDQNLKLIGEHLKEKYLNWKQNSEQIDDVCVIGFKLNVKL